VILKEENLRKGQRHRGLEEGQDLMRRRWIREEAM